MIVATAMVEGPVDAGAEARALAPHAGAIAGLDAAATCGAELRFEGVVRRFEGDPAAACELTALDYEVYEPMASRLLHELAESVARAHGLASIIALHSRGCVPVGATAFVLRVRSPHRAEAIAATTAFVDRLKREVPIWKRPVRASGEQQLR